MGQGERPSLVGADKPRLTARVRLRAWLELARLSNAPTVVSGAFCGVAIAAASTQEPFPWPVFALTGLGLVLIYTAGMILNDAIDAPIDAHERPSRPVPSGRVRRAHALVGAVALLALGVAVVATAGPAALQAAFILAGCVVVYNLIHATTIFAVLPLGACRGLVYIAAFAAVTPSEPWADRRVLLVAATVAAYTAVFSLLARREMGPRPAWTHGVPWLMVIAAACTAVLGPYFPGIALILWLARVATLWNANPPRPVHAVMAWITGLCLIDAVALGTLADWRLIIVPVSCFVATVLLQRRILGS